MALYAYPALFEPGDEAAIVVTFRDLPEAITQGADVPDARTMAAEMLGLTLLLYVSAARLLPPASTAQDGETMVTPDADFAAKLAVIEAVRDSGLSKTELAARLARDEREVRCILDPNHVRRRCRRSRRRWPPGAALRSRRRGGVIAPPSPTAHAWRPYSAASSRSVSGVRSVSGFGMDVML